MTVVDAVLEFSSAQPKWVQDGLRRLATQDRLSAQDKSDLLALLKADNGIPGEGGVPSMSSLSEEHFAPGTADSVAVSLLEIRDVRRANRLASGQSLRFTPRGITLIYGDNGSGKSGYCRLLKKLCRVREGADERVLPDAFQPRPAQPAEAVVRFVGAAGKEQSVTWLDGTLPPSALRRLSVFDSRAAPLYVDRDGKVEYLPYGLDLLPRLGQLFQDLTREIQGELRAVEARCGSPLPTVSPDTLGGKLLARLAAATAAGQLPTTEEIAEIAQFSDADSERLADLEITLSENASAAAKLLDNAAAAAKDLAGEVMALLPRLNDTSLETIRQEVNTARAARATADLAAHSIFAAEPLPGVGSDPWRRMFDHARSYSAFAYPGDEFPVVNADSRCLLCQQELKPEASDRLRRFEAYVRGAAATEAGARETAVKHRVSSLTTLVVRDPERGTSALAGFDGADESLRASAQAMLEALAARRAAMLEFTTGKVNEFVASPLPRDPSAKLTQAATTFAARSAELKLAQTDPDTRRGIEKERKELRARRILAENRKSIELRLSDLRMMRRLKLCSAACNTSNLSRKNTELRREFITEAFRARLMKEIQALDIKHLPLKVADRTDRGESYLGVSLDAVSQVKPQDILSEGERKALALASFFAEVDGLPAGTGLIFDDPVSSLDHVRREKVARRIVDAAEAGRQVVVFTHDLAFYSEVQTAAAAAIQPVAVVTHEVRRTVEHGFGTVEENREPRFVAKVGPRIPGLEKKLSDLRSAVASGAERQRQAVVAFYTDLRETWERLVEAELLNGVVSRFCKDIKTQSLKGVLIDDEDYRKVYFAMKRASDWCHSPPPAGQPTLPTADDAKSDLETLTTFYALVKQRSKRVSKKREALEAPPAAELV